MELETLNETNGMNDEERWQAVQARDSRYRGRFVYGVRSTRIYCQPGCPSKLPVKKGVRFFPTPETAEENGYRPCKRCSPKDSDRFNGQVRQVEKVCKLIDSHTEEPLSLEGLAQQVNLSPSYLHKIFKLVMGVTPRQYAARKKLDHFKNHVKQGANVTHALYRAGYSSTSRLYEDVSNRMGMTPAAYRQGGAGKSIFYTIVQTYLGAMLVGATQKGVCAVRFGQEKDTLVKELQKEYPAATIQQDDTFLAATVETLLQHLAGSLPHLDLPLDLQATAFQLRVWEELRKIPYGETRSYAQVASAIGKPKAVRAVANACGANPVPVITPCHRVIHSDGSLGGYHYGVERKKALLMKEKEK